jgi:hypothetical protein
VLDRIIHQALLLVPDAGSTVQLRDVIGLAVVQAEAQTVREEAMVTVPASLVVEGDHKEVVAFQILQDLLSGCGGAGGLRSGEAEGLGSRGV